jgi:putative beta-lysine N-acetyltransferase
MDTIERFRDSVLQHGKSSNRIYVMEYPSPMKEDFPLQLKEFAEKKGYTKIVCKIPTRYKDCFLRGGYVEEAVIPSFYQGKEDAHFLCFYLDPLRQKEEMKPEYEKVKIIAENKRCTFQSSSGSSGIHVEKCTPQDIHAMADLYKTVFPSYPFPIDDPNYLYKTMRDNIDYYCVRKHNEMVALASAEMSFRYKNVEMTDFATLPAECGQGYAGEILHQMEQDMQEKEIYTFYTIARAISIGMNATFTKQNYLFGGRLPNNTDISGHIESMNVWYKAKQ